MRARQPLVVAAEALAALAAGSGCAYLRPAPAAPPAELEVTATAYNSFPGQAAQPDDPTLAASGIRLRPGMRVVAVSDDLFELGLRFGARVRIEGMAGEWRVEDRMAPRWRRRIDVYFGDDVEAASHFGERRVRIQWEPP
jgi:3D (Asp-Asp-Asp) domain-containing protein